MNSSFKKWTWFSLLTFAVVAFVCVWLGHDHSPTYHGRALSAWIKRLPAPSTNRGIGWAPMVENPESAEHLEAEDAVRHIGTNAIPYLLAEMRAKDGAREQVLGFWKQAKDFSKRMLSRAKPPAGFITAQPTDNERTSGELRHWNAARGFHALGPLGKSAIPVLTPLLNDGSASPDAAYALSAMGPEGIAAIVPIMTNSLPYSGDWPQMCGIWALGQTPDGGRLCVPELMALAQGTNNTLQWPAIWTLGQLKTNEDLIAPTIAAHLGDSGFNVRWACEDALRNYGMTSVTRESLKKYLKDPKLSIRMAATNAMMALYPDDAAKMRLKK